jgi:hypothetical protein
MARLVQLIGAILFLIGLFNGILALGNPSDPNGMTICLGGGSAGLLKLYFGGLAAKNAKEKKRHEELVAAAREGRR